MMRRVLPRLLACFVATATTIAWTAAYAGDAGPADSASTEHDETARDDHAAGLDSQPGEGGARKSGQKPAADVSDSRKRRMNRRRKARLDRYRAAWCRRYRALVDGDIGYRDLPFVADFLGKALSLRELDDEFSAMRKTRRHHIYAAWKRYRHLIRAAELDRTAGSENYKRYTGYIMGDPEIMALGRQLEALQRAMEEQGQERTFRELLAVLENNRLDVQPVRERRRDRRMHTVVSRYHPTATEMEGGCTDSKNVPLFTLDSFLAGDAPYVSIALDRTLYERGAVRYGDEFRIPALDQRYRDALAELGVAHIVFRAVDTGHGFTGKGFSRLDLCVTTEHYDTRYDDGGKTIGEVELVKIHRRSRVDGVVE